MPTLQPYECASCHEELQPDDDVVQGVRTGEATTSGDEAEGPAALVHRRHWPPDGLRWHEIYRGPLSGISPGAT
jgi:hypothetical protein